MARRGPRLHESSTSEVAARDRLPGIPPRQDRDPHPNRDRPDPTTSSSRSRRPIPNPRSRRRNGHPLIQPEPIDAEGPDEQIVPAVGIHITDRDAETPITMFLQTTSVRHVFKGDPPGLRRQILQEPGPRSLRRRIERRTVRNDQIQISILIEVDQTEPAALDLDDLGRRISATGGEYLGDSGILGRVPESNPIVTRPGRGARIIGRRRRGTIASDRDADQCDPQRYHAGNRMDDRSLEWPTSSHGRSLLEFNSESDSGSPRGAPTLILACCSSNRARSARTGSPRRSIARASFAQPS